MDYIKASYEICYHVYQQDEKLFPSIKHYFAKKHGIIYDDRKIIQKLCVAYFHHQLAFNKIITDAFKEIRPNELYILGVGLADAMYVKSGDKDTTLASIFALLKLNKSSLPNEVVERLIENSSSAYVNGLPKEVTEGSKEYLSLKYNVPLWVVELWIKHYGKPVAEKIVAHTTKAQWKSLRINQMQTSMKEVLDHGNKELVPGASMSGTSVVHDNNKEFKSVYLINQGWLIPIDEGSNHLVNKLHTKHASILDIDYNGNKTFLALAESAKDSGNITHYVANDDLKFKSDAMKVRYGFRNIESAGGTLGFMETIISFKKDIVICEPKSSNFNAIRENPDFFVHLKQKQLDEIILGEKEMLEEGSKYVLSGGQLIYLVQTANNKEGTLVVKSFLSSHPEFILSEERQLLEIDSRRSSVYYAILKKVGK